MRIISVKLHNVFRFGNENNFIDFDSLFTNGSSIAMISGATDGDTRKSNGAGKSSVGEAIYWAFFEKLPRIMAEGSSDRKGTVVSEIVRCNEDGTIPSDIRDAYVEVIFESKDGEHWRLKRGRNIAKSGKMSPIMEVVKVGSEELLESGNKEDHKRRLEKLIGVDYQSFLNSTFFAQNNIGKFLSGTDNDRKDILMDLRGVNVIDDMIKVLRDVWKKETSDSQKVNNGRLDVFLSRMSTASPDVIRKQKMDAAIAMDALSKKLIDINTRYTSLLMERDGLLKESQEASSKLLMVKEKIKVNKENMEKAIEDAKKRLDKNTEALTKIENEISGIEKTKKEFQERYSKSLSVIEKITNASIKSRKDVVTAAKESTVDLKKSADSLKETIFSIKSDAAEVKAKIAELETRLTNIKALKSGAKPDTAVTCDKCGSELNSTALEDEEKAIALKIAEWVGKKPDIDTRYRAAEASLKHVQDKLIAFESKLSDEPVIAADEERVKAAVFDVEFCKKEAANIKEREMAVILSKSSAQQDVEAVRLEIINKSRTFDIEKQSLDKSLEAANADIVKATKKVEEINSRVSSVQSEAAGCDSERLSLQSSIIKADERLASIGKDEADLKAAQEESNRLSKKMAQIMYFDKLLSNKIKVESAESCIPLITLYTNEFLAVLKSTIRMQFSGDSGLAISLIGGSAPVFGLLSGGEKEAVRLSVNMALSMLSIGGASDIPDMIFLDEVFASLDISTKDNVFKLLDRLNRNFERICVITHDETLKERFPVSLLVDKIDGISNIKQLR
jgi:exonuclease SbcC